MNKADYLKLKYSPNREAQINSILDNYLNTHISQINTDTNQNIALALFIGGGSASGKSTLRETLIKYEPFKDFLIIDSDILKSLIPEYSALEKESPELVASIVHDESSKMSTNLFQKAVQKGINIIFDATLKNSDKYINFFTELKENKFQIKLIITTVPIDVAIKRNQARYDNSKKSNQITRLVPDEIVKDSHQKIAESFKKLRELVDSWEIMDTENNKVIASSEDGILDEEKFNNFINNNY